MANWGVASVYTLASATPRNGRVATRRHMATVGLWALALCTTAGFLWRWRYGYTSDHVLCGLMAKSILSRHERPLFLWDLGYNGILFEAYATAAVFAVFGVGVYAYYACTTIVFFCLLVMFYRYQRRTAPRRVAQLGVAFLLLQSPSFYFYVARPQPNYTEVFLLGLLWLGLAPVCVRDLASAPPAGAKGRRAPWRVAALGAVFGFALYTYQLVLFFVGTALAWLSLGYARHAMGYWSTPKATAKPVARWVLPIGALGAYLWLLGAVFFFAAHPLLLAMQVPALCVAMGGAALACAMGLDGWLHWRPLGKRVFSSAIVGGTGFVLGYAPSLYYTFVRHGASRDRLQWVDHPAAVRRAFGLFWQAQSEYFDARSCGIGQCAALATAALLIAFGVHEGRRAIRFVQGRVALGHWWRIEPLLFMPPVALVLFCGNRASIEWQSARWCMPLFFFTSLAQARTVWRWHAAGGLWRTLGWSLATLVAGHGAGSLINAWQSAPARQFTGEAVIAELDRRGIDRAYGEYWHAYSIAFFTNERIVVEPVDNNYSPHYAAVVEAADTIAYIDQDPRVLRRLAERQAPLVLGQHAYDVGEFVWCQTSGFVVLHKRRLWPPHTPPPLPRPPRRRE